MDQISAKNYLQSEVFPKLELALNTVSPITYLSLYTCSQLLETIEKNGEYENYIAMLAAREVREYQALRKRERERDRLADGDANISEDEEEEAEELSDWSASSEEEGDNDDVVSDFNVTAADGLKMPATPSHSQLDKRSLAKKTFSKASDLQDLSMRFNALRFLAMNLKSQNDTLGK